MSAINRINNNLLKKFNYIRLLNNYNLNNLNIKNTSLKQNPIINFRYLSTGIVNKFYITNSVNLITTINENSTKDSSATEDFDESNPSVDEEQQQQQQSELTEQRKIDPSIDRRTAISPETSIKYLKSDAYRLAYGDKFVWQEYRRNHKGQIPPRQTRRTCIRNGIISTGNPCPICRDEYLILDHRNLDLLMQFLSPHTGEVHSYSKTGLCQVKHRELLVAFERAKDYGYITYDVPFRTYDYSDYYTNEQLTELKQNNA